MKSVWKIVLFFILPSPNLRADAMKLAFDKLFPSTPFKKVMTVTSQIRSSVADINGYGVRDEEYELLGDLVVGRLVHLGQHVDTMLLHKSLVQSDDIEYLLDVVSYMKKEMSLVFKMRSALRAEAIDNVIKMIQEKLEVAIGVGH